MNILIVDDETAIRDGIEKRVLKYGYKTEHIYKAAFASQAREILDKYPIDLAFVDINMPFMSGLEIIEEYRSSETVFVIVSGYDNFDYARKAIELGVVRYLLKPVNRQEFQQLMDEMSERFRKGEETAEYGTLAGKILTCIRAHLKDASFSLSECAAELNMSESTIGKVLKKEVGSSFNDLVNQYRIKLATQLIMRSSERIRISWLASQCGFTSQQYFSVVFRKYTGMTPSQYRTNAYKR